MNFVRIAKRLLFVLVLSGSGISVAFFTLTGQVDAQISTQATDAIFCNGTVSATSILTLTGQIIRSDTLSPVNNVEVFVSDPIAGNEKSCFSNSTGHYTITVDATNPYNVVYNPPFGSQLAAQTRTGIKGPGSIIQDISLESGFSIIGTTRRLSDSMPVGMVNIFAQNLDRGIGFGLPPSDENGVYTISLEAGDWEITYIPKPFRGLGPTRTQTVTLITDTPQDALLPAGVTVHGQVKTSMGAGMAGVSIFALMESGDQTGEGYGFPSSKIGGEYTGTLPIGTFDIQFLPPIGQGLGPTVITNISPTTSSYYLPVTLPAGVTLSGTVACTSTLEGVFVFAVPETKIPRDNIGGRGMFSDSQGHFGLPLITGTYRLEFKPPPAILLPTLEITKNIEADTFLIIDFCPDYLPVIFDQL
jgi:hypothetical protein